MQVTGSFEVDMKPGDAVPGGFHRMSLDKRYTGPLSGSAQGEMIAAMTAVQNSASYVAVERFEGELNGRKGGFAMTHLGVMTRGEDALQVSIVPDSGTGELAGIAGTLKIIREAGGHRYELDFSLPAAAE